VVLGLAVGELPGSGRLPAGSRAVAAAGEPWVPVGAWLGACEGPLWSGDACGLLAAAQWWDDVVPWGCCHVGFGPCGRSVAMRAFASCPCCGTLLWAARCHHVLSGTVGVLSCWAPAA